MEVFIVHNNPECLSKIPFSKYTCQFRFIDSGTYKGKKEAKRFKNQYSAKLEPFIVILDNNKPIKAFYTEAEDVINSLIKYLNNESTSN
jgi:hypothetical protein